MGSLMRRAILLAAPLALPLPALAQPSCALALLLAIDVSGSVTPAGYALQRDGTDAALRSPPVVRAAEAGLRTGVMMWGTRQHLVVPFGASPQVTAGRLAAVARPEEGSTDVAGAILRGVELLAAEPCDRRVLDLSGDGAHNTGPASEVAEAVAAALAAGVEINALPIAGGEPGVGDWYREHVTGPAGGFAIEATPEAFDRAIRAKLALEVASR